MGWLDGISLESPWWRDCREWLSRCPSDTFPNPDSLTALIEGAAFTRSGKPVRFVPADSIPGVDYEYHIFETGQVSTRKESWHDLFNATAWMSFPGIKSALNAAHVSAQSPGPGRGRKRDALTLFDEGGMIILSADESALGNIARHNWNKVFRPGFGDRYRVFIVGHGLLEKCLDPFKSITANCLLAKVPPNWVSLPRDELRDKLDSEIAEAIGSGRCLKESAQLSPLPVMGIPGWWREQNHEFYADRSVFRPARHGKLPAPVFTFGSPAHPLSF